ncbi:MAG TPA: CPBP family intramembrane glutamic endopeptidase [Caulobacteraceae bacterium]|jgi:hypothetical protein|nr:CPBP family intramembrane glutamic endopeptidase [Caulobacteraceae bacterium]
MMIESLGPGLVAVVALLIGGALIGWMQRDNFEPRWLLISAALMVLNDLLLARGGGLLPRLLQTESNWEGVVLALCGSVVVASLPAFGWRACGLTLSQDHAGFRAAMPIFVLAGAAMTGLALLTPTPAVSGETIAFQATLPGLEQEVFYRGVLLYALERAFGFRWRLFGVDLGWGHVLSCVLFGLAHAVSFTGWRPGFDAIAMVMAAASGAVAVWVRLRTGSVLLPAIMHDFGETIPLLL